MAVRESSQPSLGWLIMAMAASSLLVLGRWVHRRERLEADG
jgi:hypothetical protein